MLFQRLEGFGHHRWNEHLIQAGVRRQRGDSLFFSRRNLFMADGLAHFGISPAQAGFRQLLDPIDDRRNPGGRRRHIARFLGASLSQLDDRLNDVLERAVTEGDGAQHDVLGQFLRL